MTKTKGIVKGIFIKPEGEKFSRPVDSVAFTYEGMTGDKYYGSVLLGRTHHPELSSGKVLLRNTRQVSIMSEDELEELATELGIAEVRAEWMSANLLISGIPKLSKLPVGTRFYFSGGLTLVNECQNFPCKTTARIVQEQYPNQSGIEAVFIKTAFDRRGLVTWVEYPGILRVGASCEIRLPPAWHNYWQDD